MSIARGLLRGCRAGAAPRVCSRSAPVWSLPDLSRRQLAQSGNPARPSQSPLGRIHRRDRRQPAPAPRLRLQPDLRDSLTVVGPAPAEGPDPLHRLRRPSRTPVPTRSRPTLRWRAPAKKATATCSCCRRGSASCTSSTTPTRGRRLGCRLGRGLQPAQQRAAPERLDLRRRRRTADLPALVRYDEVQRGTSTTRCASPAPDPGGLHPSGDALRLLQRPTRTCRRWACACG